MHTSTYLGPHGSTTEVSLMIHVNLIVRTEVYPWHFKKPSYENIIDLES